MIGDKNLVANPRVVTSNDERFYSVLTGKKSLSFSRVQSDSWHHRHCIFMLAVTISASFLSFFFSFSFGSWVGVELYKIFFFYQDSVSVGKSDCALTQTLKSYGYDSVAT